MLRCKRLMLNTPDSKIRSASMGLVEIEGWPKVRRRSRPELREMPAFTTAPRLGRLEERREEPALAIVADESVYVPFFLEDQTGRMLVNPEGAELGSKGTSRTRFGGSFFGRTT